MPTQEQIVEALGQLSVLELIALTKCLEDKWGIRADAMPLPGAYPLPLILREGEEQTEFDAVLVDAGPRNIDLMRTIRTITGLGLKDVKELVEAVPQLPQLLKEGLSKADAEALREQCEAAGAKVELR